ncbi:MAG TPA: peptidase M10 [Lactobacillus sp.]|nr:peptidase M10 [Lactobacillus sp.]
MHRNHFGRFLVIIAVLVGAVVFLNNRPALSKQLSSQFSIQSLQQIVQKAQTQVNTLITSINLNANARSQSHSIQPTQQESSTNTASTPHVAASTAKSTAKPADANATPVESIVSNVRLQPTYYYSYASTDSPAVRQAFAQAIDVYNATGIVTLKPGQAGSGQNQLTLSTYHEVSQAASDGAVEVGHGGPEIIQTNLSGANAINHGSAKLNTAYLSSYNEAVAIHEIGHVLGLDHSSDPNSVMYPVTQGRVQLTSGDIAGLRSIYQSN